MAIWDLFFPDFCAVCNRVLCRGEKYICITCVADAPFSYYWSWRGNPAEEVILERGCSARVATLLLYRRESKWSGVVHQFKYCGNVKIGRHFSKMLADRIVESDTFLETHFIVPVPLHWFKKFKRGFNQSEIIAETFGKRMGIPVNKTLKRIKYTSTQTSKGKEDRAKGVMGVFKVVSGAQIKGKRVLLVDDVITTGATIIECANELLKAGALEVNIAALAFVE